MNASLMRAQLLLGRGRYDLAEEELQSGLVELPGEPSHLALLAIAVLNQGSKRAEQAEQTAREAIVQGPTIALTHIALAEVLYRRNKYAEALRSIDEAIRLEPERNDGHTLRAAILMGLDRAEAAVEACDEALASDPSDDRAMNLRAFALRRQGRIEEAAETTSHALREDPDDAIAHLNQGWIRLHRGGHAEALDHFREALRLDPNLESARTGIVEALKARNWFYRQMLRYYLWASTLGQKAGFALIIGIILGQRFLGEMARANPSLAPMLYLLLGILVAAILLTWLASPIFNFSLLFHPFGRMALSTDQRRGAYLFGSLIAITILSLIYSLVSSRPEGIWGAIGGAMLLLPSSLVFRTEPNWKRVVVGLGFLVLVYLAIQAALNQDGQSLQYVFFGVIASTWVGAFLTKGT